MSNLDAYILGKQKLQVKVTSDRITLREGTLLHVELLDSTLDKYTIETTIKNKKSHMDSNGDICVFLPEISGMYVWILKGDYEVTSK